MEACMPKQPAHPAVCLDGLGAIIFDMDGVIIDGMPFHAQAWQEAFASLGLMIDPSEVYEREGENGWAAATLFLRRRRPEATRDEIRELLARKESAFYRLAEPRPFAGVEEFLDQLQARGQRLAIVTGTAREELNRSLPKSLADRFEVIVTGNDVQRGKPFPEPFLQALSQLDLPPDQALVIENAPLGIQSARAAGLRCLALASYLPCDRLRGADHCFPSIRELSVFLLEAMDRILRQPSSAGPQEQN